MAFPTSLTSDDREAIGVARGVWGRLPNLNGELKEVLPTIGGWGSLGTRRGDALAIGRPGHKNHCRPVPIIGEVERGSQRWSSGGSWSAANRLPAARGD